MNTLNKIKNYINDRAIWVALSLYIVINSTLLLTVESGIHLIEGADAGSWYSPALALLKYGSFVTLNNPETLMTYRGPLYPLFEAVMLWVGNGKILSIVIGQIVLLWITGVFSGYIVALFIPRYKTIALSLIVFNPNALGIAHLIQSDTLYALFITLSVWGLAKYMLSNNKLKWGVITSIFLSISCLIRPTGQYLILLLPAIFFLVSTLYGYKKILRESIIHGVIGIIISGTILAPWMMHNQDAGWGYVLVPSNIKAIYLRDNTRWAEKIYRNISMGEAITNVNDSKLMHISSRGKIWEKMSNKERSDDLVEYYGNKLVSYPIYVLLAGYLDSWVDFLGGGGSVNFHNLLSIDVVKAIEKNQTNIYSSRLESVYDSLSNAPVGAVLISFFSYFYVIIIRVLGLLGVIKIIKMKEYSLLLIVIGLITNFAMAAIFVGNSRYRLPVEIGFVILALYGLLFLNNTKRASV